MVDILIAQLTFKRNNKVLYVALREYMTCGWANGQCPQFSSY
jgi:hypothetical protein